MNFRRKILGLIILYLVSIPLTSVLGCTIFTITSSENVYFGNNEDYINPNTYLMIRPSFDADEYGGIYFGFDDLFMQGGINTYGLCFDTSSIPSKSLAPHPERLTPLEWVVSLAMKKCVNVSEVIELVQRYDWYQMHIAMRYQVHFADAYGDAVVISPNMEGELAFTRKIAGNGYLLSTNFNLATGNNTDCWRYNTAASMLDTVDSEDELNIEFFRDVLQSVHQEGSGVNTLYSNIFDLKNKIVYLYYFSQFDDEVVQLNVIEELDKGISANIVLKNLFSQEVVRKAKVKYELNQCMPFIAELFFLGTVILDLICFSFILINLHSKFNNYRKRR